MKEVVTESSRSTLAARAAWLQLILNRTNIDTAEMLGVSRLRVPKLVQWAESHGLAAITIHAPAGLDWELSDRLRERYGLVEALVGVEDSLQSPARWAARYVSEVLTEGGVLGIAWGQGTQAIVREMEALNGIPHADVVQLIGGLPPVGTSWHSSEFLVRLSAVLGGSAAGLLSPMIVPDEATARGLRTEPSIAQAFAFMERMDVAVFGIGAWAEGGSRVREELSAAERAEASDVVADICGVFLNAAGQSVHRELSDRILSIGELTLRNRPVRLGMAVNESKARAIDAALRSGIVTVLCTNATTAAAILRVS